MDEREIVGNKLWCPLWIVCLESECIISLGKECIFAEREFESLGRCLGLSPECKGADAVIERNGMLLCPTCAVLTAEKKFDPIY